MLRFLTAGESHGQALTAIIEGLPAGVTVDIEEINSGLKKRQGGYGRGKRMEIEKDQVEILAGVRNGVTLGSPVTLMIKNKDWENWQEVMKPQPGAKIDEKQVTKPRPGHADLPGALKYRQEDIRNILERASARETAIRVALGGLAKGIMKAFDITVLGHVVSVGNITAKVDYNLLDQELYNTPLYCTDLEATEKIITLIDKAKEEGDSLGGVVEVVAQNVPIGLGSHVHWDRRLDSRLAGALMSIPGIKGVEVGLGFQGSQLPGSKVHDQIFFDSEKGFYHSSNNSGGIEGGISNGEPLVVRGAMKPIPTLYSPLQSVDLFNKEKHLATVERSDTCAVPAAAIVAEAVVSWELLFAFLEKFSGDHVEDIRNNYRQYQEYIKQV